MATPTTIRVWESHFALYKRTWHGHVLLAFVQPTLYLLGIGLGVGTLVDANTDSISALGGITYLEFLAPALLATTAMLSAGQASLWEVLDGFLWSNRYRAMAATPLTSGQIASGLALWHATRTTIGVTGVAVVLAFFDDTRTWALVVAVPVAVLTGLAFALPLSAWSATQQTGAAFPSVIRFVLLPMFLFGGAFFPIEQLPGWVQPVAYITPLWHGIELCRGAVIAEVDPGNVAVHLGVLIGYALAGWVACRATFTRRLRP
ncbi:MAG TPA: ABC transporter permease [Ilumatobacteraceae bacterium]|jgi:lipooligosaccharide transport system permease protein|nr:ABC transporter permease [Ilumatobacteraceae bacterium]